MVIFRSYVTVYQRVFNLYTHIPWLVLSEHWRHPNSTDSHYFSWPLLGSPSSIFRHIWQANKPTTSPAESHPIAVAQPSALASVKKQSRSWTLWRFYLEKGKPCCEVTPLHHNLLVLNAGNFREWSIISINNNSSNLHSHPFPTKH